MHGESYQEFMSSKLVPVPGNIGESNLGMNPDLMNEIAKEVDVIINSAANTTFDERAKSCGWKNVYEFTKAMGELVIDENRGEIPVAIVRPSIIVSTFREPFPGWIQGNRMADPIAMAYCKGHLPAFLNPETVIDISNTELLGNQGLMSTMFHLPGVNPITLADFFNFLYEHFKSSPLEDVKGKTVDIKRLKFFSSVEDVPPMYLKSNYGAIWGCFCNTINLQITLSFKGYYFLEKFANHLECNTGRFDSTETYKLWEAMSEDEKPNFGFDVKNLDWRNYFINIHVPGLRKYVIKNGR
ncbi:hypothetical protein Patl1_26283 [Pistacia atlantica]|uniref:Uncharacterized protein n=1 Tax=Pistacia atlantica TaxID=434234 RepID=A0ACC1B1K4_9ROSI|nr:hypothetical protein Patl1_26283 [Pistacia atlantica]